MKALAAVLVLAVAAAAVTDMEQWQAFKAKYGKRYMTNEDEETRFGIFKSNLRWAESIQDPTATYGVTKFMDLTHEEFIRTYTGLNVTAYADWVEAMPVAKPKAGKLGADWSDLLGNIKNQGSCGSCWAFSATCGLEGCYALKYGSAKGHELSDQQMVDCCTAGGSDGCNGGWHDVCVEYAVKKDWATEKSYKYTAKKGSCKAPTEVGLHANTCKYYKNKKGEDGMRDGLTHNVVSVALDANTLQVYTGGIISSCSFIQLNHAVVLVADEPQYKVRNSWGEDWGEDGYFRMVVGKNCLHIADRTCVAY